MGVAARFASKRCLVAGTGANADAIHARLQAEGAALAHLAQPPELLASQAGARAAVAAAVAALGGLDVTVTAFDLRDDRSFLEISEESWSRTIEANLACVFFVACEAARVMVNGQGGTIVLVGSQVGAQPGAATAAYAAAKAGVHLLATGMALDLAPDGIRVCAVAAADGSEALLAPFTVDDLAGAVAFCASDEGSYVLGSTFFPTGPSPVRG
jgi:3-oxoacyl-[acyl-carrier protein] reductase